MHFGAMQNAQIFRQVTYFCDVGSQGELTFETSLLHFFFFQFKFEIDTFDYEDGSSIKRRKKGKEYRASWNFE